MSMLYGLSPTAWSPVLPLLSNNLYFRTVSDIAGISKTILAINLT